MAELLSNRRLQLQKAVVCCILLRVIVLLPCASLSTPSFTSLSRRTEELGRIVAANKYKTRGSTYHVRSWRHWSLMTLDHVKSSLNATLMEPPDEKATRALSFQLGVAADTGRMPSFSHSGARTGYALSYFCRARLLADLLFEASVPRTAQSNWAPFPPFVCSAMTSIGLADPDTSSRSKRTGSFGDSMVGKGNNRSCQMVSLGGGPGYDWVGAALVATFNNCGDGGTAVKATVYDFETGWSDQVDSMATAVKAALPNGHHHDCTFGGKCDITRSLQDPTNQALASRTDLFDSVSVWVCSYCVAENARQLRRDKFVFFDGLFHRAREGSIFMFTETTHRLWPDLLEVALRGSNKGFGVCFPRVGRGKKNPQMILHKNSGATVTDDQMEICGQFRRDSSKHERKMQNGYARQKRKVPGSKKSTHR